MFYQAMTRPRSSVKALNVVQLSSVDIEGGAEKLAWSVLEASRESGCVSSLVVGEKHSSDPDTVALPNDDYRSAWARSWFYIADSLAPLGGKVKGINALRNCLRWPAEPTRYWDIRQGREDFEFPAGWKIFDLLESRPDIIHGHNLHGDYFDLRALPWLSKQVPVLLTLHDAWLLSGHCAHSGECSRWLSGCGSCPDLGIYPAIRRDATAYNWRRKRDIYAKSDLYLATPSRWLMSKVEKSILAPAMREGRIIYNGVNLDNFQPGSKAQARERLNLPVDCDIILFSANGGLSNPWKDSKTLLSAFRKLSEEKRGEKKTILLVLGQAETPELRNSLDNVIFRPFVSDEGQVADFYRASDVLAYPSLGDNCPLVVIEALASGLPVVASDTGGIPELIDDGVTGLLVSEQSAPGLCAGLRRVLDDEELQRRLGAAARLSAERRFDLGKMAQAYLEWYDQILDSFIGKTDD